MLTGDGRYMVFRVADLQAYLSPEWVQAIANLNQIIQDGRSQAAMPPEPPVFVLNLHDVLAQEALKAYCRAAAGIRREHLPALNADAGESMLADIKQSAGYAEAALRNTALDATKVFGDVDERIGR